MAWEDLIGVRAEQAEDTRWARDRVLEACPADGVPLEEVGGRLHCPFGHFVIKLLDNWTISST